MWNIPFIIGVQLINSSSENKGSFGFRQAWVKSQLYCLLDSSFPWTLHPTFNLSYQALSVCLPNCILNLITYLLLTAIVSVHITIISHLNHWNSFMISLYACCLPSILHTTQLFFGLFKVNQAISFPYWNSCFNKSLCFAWSPNLYHGFKTLSDLTSAPASSQISLPFSHYILASLAHGQFLEMTKSFPTSETLLRSYLNLESCPLIPTELTSHLTSQVLTQMTPCHRKLYWSLWVISVYLVSLYYRIPLTFSITQ